MTCFNYRDRDLHSENGRDHIDAPADPTHSRRLALHLVAHQISASGGLATPIPGDHPAGMDPWLADIDDRVQSILGARIRLELRQYGHSQQQFAKSLGLNLGSLADRLSGRTAFTLAEGLYLAEEFGVSIHDLLGRDTA